MIRVENGLVVEVYSGLAPEVLEHLKSLYPGSEWVDTEEGWSRGDKWPKESVTPVDPVNPPPILRDARMELEAIITQKKQTYLAKWPSSSQVDLWPLYSKEIAALAEGMEPTPLNCPSLAGGLSVELGVTWDQVPSEAIPTFALVIIAAKARHSAELARLERAYQTVLAMGEVEDVKEAFEVAYES